MTDITPTPMFPLGGVDGEFDPTVTDGRRFTLSRPFRVVIPEHNIDITVETGFVTDFNSVPRLLWPWFSPWECVEAGVTHDWLYKHPGTRSRMDCDAVHRWIMEACHERRTKAWAVWTGIRLGGDVPWDKYRTEDGTLRIPN